MVCISIALLISMSIICFAAPEFTSPAHNTLFALTQDEPFSYLVEATSQSGTSLVFTDTSKDDNVSFSCFARKPAGPFATLINFTPTNDCVGFYSLFIIADNDMGSASLRLRFDVSNINDPPFIVAGYPELDPVLVDEGQNVTFAVEAYDDDLMHGDVLTYTWLFNNESYPFLSLTFENSTYSNTTLSTDPDRFEAGSHTVSVIVSDLEGETARHDWNLMIINVNRPPIQNRTFENITSPEDVDLIGNLSLQDYFYDPDTNGTQCDLNTGFCLEYDYTIYNITSIYADDDPYVPDSMTITITEDGNVSFLPYPNWFGAINMSFSVYDGYVTVTGNSFILNITNVNDPPNLTSIQDHSTYAYAPYLYQVEAFDIDYDPLTYEITADTLPVLSINATTGLIEGTPDAIHRGNHTIIITVSDGQENVSEEFMLEILENYPPQILPISDFSFGQHFNHSLTVHGIDPDGDSITFFTDFRFVTNSTRINDTSWNFTFYSPQQSSIGTHTVRIYANDTHGALNWTEFEVEITDTLVPPILEDIYWEDYQLRIDKRFVFVVEATDEDFDMESFDVSFSDMVDRFGITTTLIPSSYPVINATIDAGQRAEGLIDWTPDLSHIGSFGVNISINDSQGFVDYRVFTIQVTNNRPPYFTNLQDLTISERVEFNYMLRASDPDWQDREDLTFSSNYSTIDPGFHIDPLSGLINWTPQTQGTYLVYVSVSDGSLTTIDTIEFNVTERNDPPEFINLSTDPNWLNITQDALTSFYVTASDRENDTLSFSVEFLNYTDLKGDTFYTDIDLFELGPAENISNIYRTLIEFTPSWYEVGKYFIRLNVTDGNSVTSEIVNFTVININNVPFFNWTIECFNATGGTYSYLFSNRTYDVFNCVENMSIAWEIEYFDPDYDDVSVYWNIQNIDGKTKFEGSSNRTDFIVPFDGYPNMTFSITLDDGNEELDIMILLNITNVNRPITFGQKIYLFTEGRGTFYNTTVINETLTISNIAATYPFFGSYISEAVNFRTTSYDMRRLNITYLQFYPSPSDTDAMSYSTATSHQNTTPISSWDAYTIGDMVISPDYRFIRFRIDYNLTDETAVYHNLSRVDVLYEISDLTVSPNTEYNAWIDLNTFFFDPDEDDTITYEYSIISGEGLANITIFQGGFVSLTAFDEEGEMEFFFTGTDDYGESARSNDITITIENVEENPTPIGGGGGSTIVRVPRHVYREVDVYYSLNMIHPMNITIYENDTVVIPIIIQNEEDVAFEDIQLEATVDREGLDVFFDIDMIELLEAESNMTVFLTLNMTQVYDSYGITVSLNSSNPSYEDSARIMVSSLTRARQSDPAETMKLAFVSDLLDKNPECLEVSEYIDRARQSFERGSSDEGMQLLENFIYDCKLLISAKQPAIEEPRNIEHYLDWVLHDMESLLLTILITVIMLGTIITIIVVSYKRI